MEEAAPEDSAKKLQKAVLNAKVKWLEEAGKKAEGEDAEAAQKLADELLVEDPKLLKALLWKLGVAESKLKEAVSFLAIPGMGREGGREMGRWWVKGLGSRVY